MKRAYLNVLFESLPGSVPIIVARHAAIQSSHASLLTVHSSGIWANVLEAESDTFQEAHDRIMDTVRQSKSLRPLLVWLDESFEAHEARGLFQRLSR